MVSRWARPATVLNSYSLLTGLRQRAVNAGCMFAAFITLPYHCHESGTCSSKGKYFKHNDAVTRASVIKCKILKEVAEEVIGFHSRSQFNCSCDFQITRAVAKSRWYSIERFWFNQAINQNHLNILKVIIFRVIYSSKLNITHFPSSTFWSAPYCPKYSCSENILIEASDVSHRLCQG